MCIFHLGAYIGLKGAQSNSEFKSRFSNCDFSEWYNYENKEVEWYNNAINILNNKAMEFYNTNYVIDARCVGSNPTNKERETKETAKIPMEVLKYDEISDETGVKDEDDNFETDYNILQNLNILNVNRHYWFASRYNEISPVYGNYKGLVFYLRYDDAYEYAYYSRSILETRLDSGRYYGEIKGYRSYNQRLPSCIYTKRKLENCKRRWSK